MNRSTVLLATGFFVLNLACAGGKENSIRIVSPKPGDRVSGPLRVKVEIDGSKTEDWAVTLTPGTELWSELPEDELEFDMWSTSSGPLIITAGLYGKEDDWITHEIEVYLSHDWDVAITADPPMIGTVSGVHRLIATPFFAADGIATGEFQIDGELLGTLQDFPWDTVWDTRRYQDGPHTITVVATRLDGETTTVDRIETTSNCDVVPIDDRRDVRDVQAMADGTLYILYPEKISRWTPSEGLNEDWVFAPSGELQSIGEGLPGELFVVTHDSGVQTIHELNPTTAQFTVVPSDGSDGPVHAAHDGRLFRLVPVIPGQPRELHVWTRTDGWSLAAASYPSFVEPYLDSNGNLWTSHGYLWLSRSTLDAAGHEIAREDFDYPNGFKAFGEDDQGRILGLTEWGVEQIDPVSVQLVGLLPPQSGPYDPYDGSWQLPVAMTHVKHRPGCNTILVANGNGLGVNPSQTPGTP